jgi:hypothetical protein
MALFLMNTGLSCLAKGKELDTEEVNALFAESPVEKVPSAPGAYATHLFDSGLSLIARLPEGNEGEAYLDMHMNGKCLWHVKPVSMVGEPEYLGLSMIASDMDEENACVLNMVKPALHGPIDTTKDFEVQVCAFPVDLAVYDDREAFEAMVPEGNRLFDRQVLPYYYIMAKEERVDEKTKAFMRKNEQLDLFCGSVLAVEKRENGYKGTSLCVATVATVFGHIDLVYGEGQVSRPLEKGSYVLASAYVSAEIVSVVQQ